MLLEVFEQGNFDINFQDGSVSFPPLSIHRAPPNAAKPKVWATQVCHARISDTLTCPFISQSRPSTPLRVSPPPAPRPTYPGLT